MEEVIYDSEIWRPQLLQGLHTMVQSMTLCDVHIETAEREKIKAHSCILAAASPKLHAMFTKVKRGAYTLRTTDINSATWKCILQFVYLGHTRSQRSQIEQIKHAAKKLDLVVLCTLCDGLLAEGVKQSATPQMLNLVGGGTLLGEVDLSTPPKNHKEKLAREAQLAMEQLQSMSGGVATEAKKALENLRKRKAQVDQTHKKKGRTIGSISPVSSSTYLSSSASSTLLSTASNDDPPVLREELPFIDVKPEPMDEDLAVSTSVHGGGDDGTAGAGISAAEASAGEIGIGSGATIYHQAGQQLQQQYYDHINATMGSSSDTMTTSSSTASTSFAIGGGGTWTTEEENGVNNGGAAAFRGASVSPSMPELSRINGGEEEMEEGSRGRKEKQGEVSGPILQTLLQVNLVETDTPDKEKEETNNCTIVVKPELHDRNQQLDQDITIESYTPDDNAEVLLQLEEPIEPPTTHFPAMTTEEKDKQAVTSTTTFTPNDTEDKAHRQIIVIKPRKTPKNYKSRFPTMTTKEKYKLAAITTTTTMKTTYTANATEDELHHQIIVIEPPKTPNKRFPTITIEEKQKLAAIAATTTTYNPNDTKEGAEDNEKYVEDETRQRKEPTERPTTRFPTLTAEEKDELTAKSFASAATMQNTRFGVKVFKDWLKARYQSEMFEELEAEELAELLHSFYAEVRDKDGKRYGQSTLRGIRAALNRYIRMPPYNRTIDITKNPKFIQANHVFDGYVKANILEGNAIVKQKEAFSDVDWEKLLNSKELDPLTPKGLQNKVFVDMMTYFTRKERKGRYTLRQLTKKSFEIGKDEVGGFEYVRRVYQQGPPKKDSEKNGIMVEQPGNSKCPVKSFKSYINKLDSNCDLFFTIPNHKTDLTKKTWYSKRPIGHNTLGRWMLELSKSACLSYSYTNNVLRAAGATRIPQGQGRKIMSMTGHTNESEFSQDSYTSTPASSINAPASSISAPASSISAPVFFISTPASSINAPASSISAPVFFISSSASNISASFEQPQSSHSDSAPVTIEPPKIQLPTVTAEEKDQLAAKRLALQTIKVTRFGAKVFKDWLKARHQSEMFEELKADELAELLHSFYAEVRDKDGKRYGHSTLRGIRAALNRHIKLPPYNQTIDITKNPEFIQANYVFDGYVKANKLEGNAIVKHKEAISDVDWEKLLHSKELDPLTPKGLQNKVFVDIMTHFTRRERESLRMLTKKSFEIVKDEVGDFEYVRRAYQQDSKIRDPEENGIMVEQPGNPKCPVKSFKSYMNKLDPNFDVFFTFPNHKTDLTKKTWYTIKPIGDNTLGRWMAELSKSACLSHRYTNHGLRAAGATRIPKVNGRKIKSVTRHTNESESSQDSYISAPSSCMSTPASSISALCEQPQSSHSDYAPPVTKKLKLLLPKPDGAGPVTENETYL